MDNTGHLNIYNADGKKTFEGSSFAETGVLFEGENRKERRAQKAEYRKVLKATIRELENERTYIIDKICNLKIESKGRLVGDRIFRQIELFQDRKAEIEDEIIKFKNDRLEAAGMVAA